MKRVNREGSHPLHGCFFLFNRYADALKILINKLFLEKISGERKKTINILIDFIIFYKSIIKTLLN